MTRDNVVLIGMPAAGKSTVGVILAKVMGYQFIDSDLVIQHEEKKLLSQIIEEQGVEGFIQVENRINSTLDVNHSIIATGGSVVYGREAMKHLGEIGIIVYIKLDYQTIVKRLGDIKQRGVVLKEGQTLYDIYKERCELYEKYADITIDGRKLNIEQSVEAIMEQVKNII